MEPFIGMVCLFAFSIVPRGWARCNGQLLSIVQNQALFSLIGTTYGGDGVTTFALPDLRGRVPNGCGQGPGLSEYVMGQAAGEEHVTLLTSNMPQHNHLLMASEGAATTNDPQNNYLARSTGVLDSGEGTVTVKTYGSQPMTAMNPMSIGMSGGTMPHDNMQPYLTMSYCIALQGIYPSQG
ncbi:phage tail protein [Arsenicibacter rosenii]|uniref:Phage tail protein n=1 Tax=Arsenicibacter rosenii TaxID=1750698 RepID=A0A1S2VKA5_9BACT|nr:tail fiber protein [Arsenicibacter rosenii]OIN59192.1 phage tail protein [Arsenicibacter rosenii]